MNTPIELTIPGWWKKKMIISDDEIVYGSTRLLVKELTHISYHSTTTNHYVYFIPTGSTKSYSFSVGTDSENISVNYPGGGTKPQEIFNQLFIVAKHVFEPVIVKRLLLNIMRGETVKVGGISLNKEGFHKKTLFSGIVSIPWNQFAGTVLEAAVVHIFYLTENNSKKELTSIPLATINAAVLSELTSQCHNEYAKYSVRGIRVCTSCGKETESDGKFCQHCGTSLPLKR